MSAFDSRDRRWRAWDPSDGLRVLARYVAPNALAEMQFEDVDTRAVVPGQSRAAQDRAIVERLYGRLAAKRVEYGRDPWNPEERGQEIRHPRRLVERRVGNCLEFAVTYGAMCLGEQIPPLLAVTRSGPAGHAFVIATPGRSGWEPLEEDAVGTDGDTACTASSTGARSATSSRPASGSASSSPARAARRPPRSRSRAVCASITSSA